MPFPRPTLTALRTQAMQDITASDLPNADGFLRRSALRILAWVQAGLAYLHYGYLDWIAREGVPFTATDEYLEAWASLAPTGILREAPTPATGPAQWSGTTGTPLPGGTLCNRADGVQFSIVNGGTVGGGNTVSVTVLAVVPGSAGNTDSGSPLTLATTISGINPTGVALAELTGGTDLETDSHLRMRMLQAFQNPPQGGAIADYILWCLAVPGVTRAWCLPLGRGPGTVVVYTMFDVTEAAFGGFPQGTNGVAMAETRDTPATGDQLAVANYIFPLRPVTALVYSDAPTGVSQNFTVNGLVPSNPTIQASIIAALAAMLVQKASPLADSYIDQSDADDAISAVPGVVSFRVAAPSFPVTPGLGNILVLGTVTFS